MLGSAGTTSIQGNGLVGGVTGTLLNGIVVGPSSGDVHIGDTATNGVVTALANCIWINNTGAANNTIVQNNDVTGGDGFYGIITGTATGATSITATADTKGGTGIGAISTTGAIVLNGEDTGTLTGTALDGATVTTLGAATVNNFATVTGARNGIYVLGSAGVTNVQGNGDITGTVLNGIVVGPSTGDVNIGTVKTNGVITGGVNGIWVNNLADGNTNIVVDKDVTGSLSGGWGILSTTVNGNNTVNVKAGIVTGNAALEVTTVGSGNVATTIGADAIVDGTTWGYVTTTGTGTGVTDNSGIIKTTADTGAADIAGSGLAVYAKAGDNTVNNLSGGQIIGGITTAGTAFTLNNQAGGVWTPSLANSFGAINDTVNNAGLISVRTGLTNFAGLETLNNSAGGVIDMTYGGSGAIANARDSLLVVNFSPKAGSVEKFNVDFTQANSVGTEALANDHSSNGKGTADTIVVFGKGTPQAKSTVNLAIVGAAAVGTSGSIALVNAVPGGLADPGLGGFATMIASSKYTLAADPSTGAVVYRLVDDKNGGVYLQWAPNLSAVALGAYGGGAVGAGTLSARTTSGAGSPRPINGAGPGGISNGGAIASASASSNGVGGLGLSGGPSGGGAAGQVADMAAGSAMSLETSDYGGNGGGSIKDGGFPAASGCPADGRGSAWAAGDVSRSNSDGGGNGRSNSLAGGVEANVGEAVDMGCRRVAVGIFGFTGDSSTAWGTGRDKSSNDGIGGYLRVSSAMGLYGSLLGAVSWSDHDLSNLVFNSTANKNATGLTGVATIGYASRLAGIVSVDLRSYVAFGNVDGDGFTDSRGITVSGTNDDLVTIGGSVGLYAPLAPSTQGFVRGGVKWAQVDSSITAFGVTQNGSAEEVSGSVESGFVARTAEGIELGASGFGEFSDSTTSYGGRAHVGVKF